MNSKESLLEHVNRSFPGIKVRKIHNVNFDANEMIVLVVHAVPTKLFSCECNCGTFFDHFVTVTKNVFDNVIHIINTFDCNSYVDEIDAETIKEVVSQYYSMYHNYVVVSDIYVYEIFSVTYIGYELHYNIKTCSVGLPDDLSKIFTEYTGKRIIVNEFHPTFYSNESNGELKYVSLPTKQLNNFRMYDSDNDSDGYVID